MAEIQFQLYNLPDGSGSVQVRVEDETIWLTQKAMADLFGVDRSVITKHLKNIFESSELQEDAVCAKFAHTASDGKNYQTYFYNLDAIISVGYRVNSQKATRFRQWSTRIRPLQPDPAHRLRLRQAPPRPLRQLTTPTHQMRGSEIAAGHVRRKPSTPQACKISQPYPQSTPLSAAGLSQGETTLPL